MQKIFDRCPPSLVLALTVISSALPFLLVELFPSYFYWVMDITSYLVFHNLAEFFSVMVSLSIFGVGWFSYNQSRDYHALLLSTAFLVVGLVDSMHTLSYVGMPEFFTPNSADKASRFWVLVRMFSASVFLASAFIRIKTTSRRLPRMLLLAIALAISALAFTIVIFFPEYMPAAFVPGQGQTPFKKNSEYLIIVLLLLATAAYWRRMSKTGNRLLLYYLTAFIVSIFSELVFAFYKNAFDSYNGLGHLYKIVAFCLIYKGIFTSLIEHPYVSLAQANNHLHVEIAERKRAEENLRHMNRELQAISNCNQTLMRAEDEQTLLNEICHLICDKAGYRMAWVGYAEHDNAKSVRPVAWAGVDNGYLAAANLTWADTERGRGPVGTAVRSEVTACIQDFVTDPQAAPWRENALQRGYRSCIALPLRDQNGNVFGALIIYSTEPNTFTLNEIRLLEELAGDLAFGITVLRARTELKQAEATRTQLAAIVEYSNDAIIGKTPNGIVSHWNKSAERIYGYSATEIIGKPVTVLAPPALHAEIKELLEKIRNGEVVVSHESERIRKDGTLIHVAITLSPIKDASGNTIGISTITRDITEHKRNAEELRRYKDHLEEEVQQRTEDLVLARNAAETANQAKSVFLSNMSHELRTPLNAILGFSKLMRKDTLLPESHRQNLDIINRSGEHLLTLINDVLEMAKIEAGRLQLENAAFDLGAMVRDVTDMMLIRAGEKGLRLLVDQSSQFPRYIAGDEARLRQVLINLIGNSIKFTEQGGVTLRLGTRQNSRSHLVIEIEDSGPGIAQEDQQRIFEPFVQLDSHWDNKGTGLGLSLSRQFVQLMGGSIKLESTVGKGTLFRIDLPLSEVAEADIIQSKQAEKGDIVGLEPGQPDYRILIVEDKLENQLLLTKLMESVGFQVKVAENGEQGVKLFQSWHPHFIWMDRRMPVMDGLEATRRIRKLPGGKDVKIVAVTASAFIEQRSESIDAGMDDFVRKPYRFNEIYECMSKQLSVKYIYDGMSEPEQQAVTANMSEMLSVLPESLRYDLTEALESLETNHIAQVIQQIATYDPKLQKTLSHLADTFDYTAILKALQTN
ncbi:MASE3 domain-containing protein [Candidatus Methylobacter oryzae]|uniref:histidine kinase n=1 Tax=Candidatus Methylobacter oryzae TaxID=2497749 RepID=A0ABY3C6I5_9GAMM|nr:MASE3 domain-containing protein [Candidatus Methylobacter oryzae]TRW91209.1 PAS domain S-box protein [Candidatus Methylobacter oryzae]